jgi:hypothetical protein
MVAGENGLKNSPIDSLIQWCGIVRVCGQLVLHRVEVTYGIIQCSGSKKSALLGKSGAQSTPETQFLAYCFLIFCSARETT